MNNKQVSPERFRLLKSIAIVVAILIVAPGVDAVVRYVAAPQEANVTDSGIDARVLVGSGDAAAALDRIEGFASSAGADVPREFSEEVGFLSGVRDIRASCGGSVVGYVVDSDVEIVSGRLARCMESRGWTEVPLGDMDGATFMKDEGACRWALATCTQVGQATCVVMRCVIL